MGVTTLRRVGLRQARPVADELAAALGVPYRLALPLALVGVEQIADMAGWTAEDLADVPQVGPSRLPVLVVALRAAGVRLPDGPAR